MANQSPMDILRDLAEKTLNDATTKLGNARQQHAQERSRLEQLQHYAHEYRQQLQTAIVERGVSVFALQAQQNFLSSLDGVVVQQARRVSVCQGSIDNALHTWTKDKQRLNAFDALKSRAAAQQLLKENRLEQKMMDEFARRASQRNS